MAAGRPLSKERRKVLIANYGGFAGFQELLAAEQYWREVVKSVPEFAEYGMVGECFCNLCAGELSNQHVAHKPDCPWLLAQEE